MKNLLLVDDEELLVENMKFLLSPHFARVFTARNGKEALALFENENIHCIVSDLTMPVMNGLEFLKELRFRDKSVPFIIYSAYINDETITEISRFNVFRFLKKPDFLQIENTVLSALKGNTCINL